MSVTNEYLVITMLLQTDSHLGRPASTDAMGRECRSLLYATGSWSHLYAGLRHWSTGAASRTDKDA